MPLGTTSSSCFDFLPRTHQHISVDGCAVPKENLSDGCHPERERERKREREREREDTHKMAPLEKPHKQLIHTQSTTKGAGSPMATSSSSHARKLAEKSGGRGSQGQSGASEAARDTRELTPKKRIVEEVPQGKGRTQATQRMSPSASGSIIPIPGLEEHPHGLEPTTTRLRALRSAG